MSDNFLLLVSEIYFIVDALIVRLDKTKNIMSST